MMMFFFFKQKTAYEIVDCDWSSDVCSSDLLPSTEIMVFLPPAPQFVPNKRKENVNGGPIKLIDRKSVVQGKSVDLGGRRIIKKKKKKKKKNTNIQTDTYEVGMCSDKAEM